MAGRVLVVCTSHDQLGDTGNPTGCWYEEVATPYWLWREKGVTVDIASIKGGKVPFDPASASGDFCTAEAQAFIDNAETMAAVDNSLSIEAVLSEGIDKYDAVFVPGGHGIVWDGHDAKLKELLEKFWAAGKVVSAVCHGPCGLLAARDSNGDPIVKGRSVAGFSNSEERAVGKDKYVPYLLEDKLKELGGSYTAGPDWGEHAVSDGKAPALVTGQNPGSSKRVAQLVWEAMSPPIQPTHDGKGPGEGLKHRGPHDVAKPDHHEHEHKGSEEHGKQSSWHQPHRPPL